GGKVKKAHRKSARGGTDAKGTENRRGPEGGAVTLLAGTTALVTGGAGGIGRAIAERAFREGARLAIGDIDAELLAQTAKELQSSGAEVVWRKCDVRRPEDIDQLLAACRDRFGDPDVLFANAGIEGKLSAPWEV